MEKLNNYLKIDDGIFSKMPTDIWGEDFLAEDLDLELFVKHGDKYASALVKAMYVDGTLDTERLANYIYNKYNKNWKKIYDALILEYNVDITSTKKYTLERKEDFKKNEMDSQTRDLQNTKEELVNNTEVLTKEGAIKDVDTKSLKTNLDETKTDTTATTKSGSLVESIKNGTVYNSTNTTTDTTASTRTGSIANSNSESMKYGSENKQVFASNVETKDTGTVSTQSDVNVDSDGNDIESIKAIGSTAFNQAKKVDSSANVNTDSTETVTNNTTNKVTNGGQDTASKSGTDTKTATDTTTYNALKDANSGSVINKKTGDDTNTISGTTTYNNIKDVNSGTVKNLVKGDDTINENKTTTFEDLKDTKTGNVKNDISQNETGSITNESTAENENNILETYKEEGSSPLKTYQALINQEIKLRNTPGTNFLNIIMENVSSELTLDIWEV